MEESKPQVTPSHSGVKSFLTYRLSRLNYSLDIHAAALLTQYSTLSLVGWRIISLINHEVSTTLTEMATISSINEFVLQREMRDLLQEGYVVSSPSATTDAETELFSLSPSGKALHSRLLPQMVIRQTQLTASLSTQEMQALDSLLDKLNDAALEMRESVR